MVQPIIDGRKAGESSPRQPVIAPDSARSVTLLKQVVGLSEGEIEGFGKDDIKLDGTPLSELSSEIVCDYRFGTNSQEYINGVDEVANEIGVGVELRGDLDWVKLITNTDIDHVGIRLRWGPLQTSHSNGDVSGVNISYQILIAPVGGAYEEVLVTTLSDKTSDSYERYHEFKLPSSDDGWMVKVIRITPSAQSSLISDKMYVQSYAEIIKSKFTFPYTSLIYLEYDARSFSNVAKLAVNAKGMIVKVPMNYNPVTRQYTGLWDGVFKMAYTNNPAWIYYDIVTQRRYGCGDRIDQSMVDKWSLYRLGQYCDQMVDDGYGGLEPRFTCNVYLQSKERVYDVLNRLTGLFRAINFWNGSQLVVDADIPQDTSYLYTNANVVDGLFEYAGTAATDLYSAVKVAWDNPANGYNTEYEAVSYEHLVKKLGFKTLELDAWGCTSRGQALRAGRWALLAESDTVTFKVGMDGYLAMPGKIIEIQDEFYAGKSVGGRVISVSSSGLEITLDRPVETIAGDTISFNTVLGVVKKFNIASSNGTVVTLTESVGSSVERMHIWAINSSQLATQKYRILSVKFDGVGEFTISAVEYDQNKYEEIDSNIVFDEAPTSIINPIAQVAVKNVTISSNEYVYQGLNTVNLEIKWERAENAVEYLVELKKDDGSWLKLPSTGNNSIVLENVYAGYYIASVTAVSAYELKSLPAYSVKTVVLGKQSMPLPPLNPRIVPIQFGIEFYWDFPQGATDAAVSRIVVAYIDPTGAVDDSGFLSYDKAYSDNKIVIQNLDLHTRVWFKVKLIDKLGFESPYTSWISGIPSQDFDKVMDLISGQIEQSDLYYDLSQKIDVGFGASAAATNAQTAADQAQASADQAQTAANQVQAQVTATTAELRGLLDVTADGLTQEILDRQDGDADVVGQLTTYKTSNDAAMSAVQQQVEAATSASSANATALTNLNTEVVAASNLASNALQQAQSATDTSSTNASNLIALSSRMDSAVQAGDNLLVNSNVDKPYNGNYPHGVYNLGEAWEAGATYTLLWCASFVRNSPDQNILVLAAYAGGGNQSLQTINTDGERQVHKVTFVVRPEGAGYNEIAFFLLNSIGGYLDAVATIHWAVLVKASDINTKVWVRSKYDIDNAINAKLDASAINEYYTKVQADQATAGQITTFESTLALGGGWMDIGREGAQQTIERGAGTIEVIDRTRNHFKTTATSDGEFSAYIGACNNSSAIPVGTPYVLTGKIRASQANLYDRMYARFNQHSSESYVYGWNASSDWVTFKTSGVTNTQEQYPIHNIIGAYVPNAIAGDWVEFKDCRISVNSDSVTAANAQAIRNTETNVATIDGKVAAQATDILNLSTGLTNLNNTKLDASVISNYYTRGQADDKSAEIAAGKIESYNAKLVIGGTNLLLNSDFSEDASWAKWGDNGGGYTKVSDTTHGSVIQTNLPNGLVHDWVRLENNVEYTYSALVKPSNDLPMDTGSPLHYWAGKDYTHQAKIHVLSTSHTLIEAGKWTRISIVFKLVDDANTFRPFIFGLTGVLQIAWTKLELGNKATDWSPNTVEIQQAINANTSAIQSTSADVSLIDGKLTAQATDILNLNTNLTNLNNSKLDAAIIQQYRTAVDQDNVTAGELTQFSAALKLGGDNLLTGTKTFNNQNNDLATSTFHPNYAGFGDHWVTDAASLLFGTHTLVQCTSHWRGFYYRHPIDSAENWFAKEDMVVSFWAASMGGVTNVYGIAGGQGYIFSVTTGEFKQYSMFIPKGTAIRNNSNQGIIEFAPTEGATLYYGGVMLQYGSKATAWQPSLMDSEIDTSQFASATAFEQTKTQVQEINGQVSSLAQQTNTLSTTVGNNTAAIQLQQSSIDGINAKATLQVEAGGTIGGVALGNNGGVVDFIIRSNTFAITTPEGVPNDTNYMMTYQANDQTLPNGTVIPKGLKVNDAIIGTINASKIYADSLSAISGTFGTITTLQDAAKPLGVRTVMTGGVTVVYDDNNIRRARFGFWSD